MSTEVGTAYATLMPSAKGFAKNLRREIARELGRSDVEKLVGEQFAHTRITLPVVPEVRPEDVPDELRVRRGREPKLPVELDPLLGEFQSRVRREVAALSREVGASVGIDADGSGLRGDLAGEVDAAEKGLKAQIPAEPTGMRDFARELRERVAEVARTVRARIRADVDIDVDKPLKGKALLAGESVGQSLASGIAGAVSSGLSSGPVLFAGLAAAAAVTGPLIGATIAAGVLSALGGGVIVLGIAALADDPRLKGAASDLSATLKKTLADAAGPLLGTKEAPGPLLRAMETLKQLVIDIGPSLKEMFAAVGPYIPELAEGIASFVKEAMPGIVKAVKASGPVLEVIALNLGPLGETVGRFLSLMAELAPAAKDSLNVLFFLVNQVITGVGTMVYLLGAAFSGLFANFKQLVSNVEILWKRVTYIFTGGQATVRERLEAFIGLAIRLWRSFTDRLTGGARGAIGSVTGLFSGLPGRIRTALGNLGGLLYQAGRNVVQGLINGLQSMFRPLRGAASSMAQIIRNHLPFSPAKEGPLSGSGNPYNSGRSIVRMLSDGVTDTLGTARSAASDLAGTFALDGSRGPGIAVSSAAVPAPAAATLAFGGDAPDSFLRWMRENVRIYYGGSAQAALGSGRVA